MPTIDSTKMNGGKMSYSTASYQNKKEHYSDQDLRDLFDAFGRSGKGGFTLTKDLRLCFNCLGLNPKETELKETLFLLKRDNEDPIIDTEDFLQMARAKLGPDEPIGEAELREAFAMYDEDGSGTIDPSELRTILKDACLEDDMIEQLVIEADTDGDGEIDFEEFYQLFQTMMG